MSTLFVKSTLQADEPKILAVIDPASPSNPWANEFVRARNEVILLWLYHLGIRRGELLNIRTTDMVTEEDIVAIKRRADDPTDPRRKQPKVKTRGRKLILSSILQEKTDNYMINYRRNLPVARKHFFLFVSKTGRPLSVDACAKIFSVLREKCPDVPHDFTAHMLRHSWNENFSDEMDKNNIGEEMEKKLRAYQMGWKETSPTGAI